MKKLNVAMIGTGFMAKAHSLAYAAMPLYFSPPPALPVRKVVVSADSDRASAARDRLQFEGYSSHWEDVVNRDDIDIVDICTMNDSHARIAIAAAKAGKHIICEKPLARTAEESKAMLDAVEAVGVTHMVGYNYRHIPAVIMAKQLIDGKRIGDVLTFRGHYQQDWSADPETPTSWRLQRAIAGSGTLGDIGTHIIDMARYLVGEFEAVNAVVKTFIPKRPVRAGVLDKAGIADGVRGATKAIVDVDDYVLTMIRFIGGVVGSIESSRNSQGRHNWLGFEVQGTRGTIVFDYQRLNELQVMFADDQADTRGFRTIFTGPAHPYGEYLWPVPAIGLGYADIKIIECFNFLKSIIEGRPGTPSFRDGYQAALIAEAILASSESQSWVSVPQP
jgi:predicted dehydrogenase